MAALRGLVLYALARAGASLMVKDDPLPVCNLTFCNAYAESKPLSVYTLRTMAKVMEEPLKYKECRLVQMQLAEGTRGTLLRACARGAEDHQVRGVTSAGSAEPPVGGPAACGAIGCSPEQAGMADDCQGEKRNGPSARPLGGRGRQSHPRG